MRYIKKYNKFLEKYNVAIDESPQDAADKNQYNDNEFFITEFNSKKATLDNIYKTYKDRPDLISKLRSQKMINSDGSRPDEIRFINPLLQLWSQIASYNREVVDIDDKLKKYNTDLSTQKAEASSDPNRADVVKDQMNNTNNSIKTLNDRLKEINNNISDVKKQLDNKIREMTNSLNLSKERIDSKEKNKTV